MFSHPMWRFLYPNMGTFAKSAHLYVPNMMVITYYNDNNDYDDDDVEEDRNIPQVGIAQGLLCLY